MVTRLGALALCPAIANSSLCFTSGMDLVQYPISYVRMFRAQCNAGNTENQSSESAIGTRKKNYVAAVLDRAKNLCLQRLCSLSCCVPLQVGCLTVPPRQFPANTVDHQTSGRRGSGARRVPAGCIVLWIEVSWPPCVGSICEDDLSLLGSWSIPSAARDHHLTLNRPPPRPRDQWLHVNARWSP